MWWEKICLRKEKKVTYMHINYYINMAYLSPSPQHAIPLKQGL